MGIAFDTTALANGELPEGCALLCLETARRYLMNANASTK